MKKWVTILALVFMMILPNRVAAYACSDSDKVRFSTIASNITTRVDLVESNGVVSFNVVFINVDSDLKIINPINGAALTGTEVVVTGLTPNTNYQFSVMTDRYGCSSFKLRTIDVTTPAYNPYYNDAICSDITDYKLCQKWTSFRGSYSEFVTTVQKYKDSLKTPNEEEPTESVKGIYDYIFEFLGEYYLIIFPVIIVAGSGTIYYLRKKKEFF